MIRRERNDRVLIRPILTIPQSQTFLRQRCTKIHTFPGVCTTVVQDLNDTWPTVAAHGIAAPQIGAAQRIFVYRPHEADESAKPIALINPKIVRAEGELFDYDGCLSVPGIYGNTRRAERIEVTAQDLNGKKVRHRFEGFTARIVQHEIDHLEGVLFIDRIDDIGGLYRLTEQTDADGNPRWAQTPLDEETLEWLKQHRRPLPVWALRW